MTTNFLRSAALAVFALGAGLSTSLAFAQVRDIAPVDAGIPYLQPGEGADDQLVPPDTMGQFTCAYNEPHTRLERKDCGGVHYAY